MLTEVIYVYFNKRIQHWGCVCDIRNVLGEFAQKHTCITFVSFKFGKLFMCVITATFEPVYLMSKEDLTDPSLPKIKITHILYFSRIAVIYFA